MSESGAGRLLVAGSEAPDAPDALGRLQEELRIHAIELELQNDELRGSRARLESSQEEFHRLFDLAPIGYFVVDEHSYVERANRVAHELLREKELTQQRLTRFVKVHQIPAFEDLLRSIGSERRSTELDLIPHSQKATPSTVNVQAVRLSSEPPCVLLCIEDITALKRATRRAQDSEAGLRHLIDVSPDAMAVVRQGKIVLANAALRELVDRDEEAVIGSGLVDYVRVEERHAFEAAVQLAVQRGTTGYVQLHLADTQRALEARFATLNYEGLPSVLVVARDITERMRAAAELEHSSRLASLGMLVAGVAHEINNPLTFVLPSLDDALERLLSMPPDMLFGVGTLGDAAELIREAKGGVERVAAIVKDLKVFHKVKESLELVDLNQVVVDTLKMAVPKLGHRVTVFRDLGNLPTIVGNVGRLGQIVLNLLLNASQSMPPGRLRTDNQVHVRTWFGEDGVHLEVQDNGRGIEEADLKKLFDPFFSKRGGGTGLGLTVCASLVREMNGWIEVDSQVTKGSRFVLRFPKAEERPQSSTAASTQTRRVEGLRLLVVDDEPLIFRTISRGLGKQLSLVQARSGYEAIAQLRQGLKVDAVLTDVVMPEGTGLELFEWVREHRPELGERFIFMTGMAHPETLGELPDRPHLQKPFSIGQAHEALSALPVAIEGGVL